MKKMRFLAFMLSAAFLATTFTSCSDDDDDLLDNFTFTIVTPEENPYVGEEFSVNYTVTSIENIEKIDVFYDNESVYSVAKKELAAKKIHTDNFKYTADEAGTYKFSLIVEDRKGNTDKKDFTVEVVEETTALGDWEELLLGNPKGADNPQEGDAINLKYNQNKDANTAEFKSLSGNADIVFVDNANYDTVESLEAAYNDGTKVAEFTAKSDANFEEVYFITLVNEEYVLVHFKDLKFTPGNHKAEFQYKK